MRTDSGDAARTLAISFLPWKKIASGVRAAVTAIKALRYSRTVTTTAGILGRTYDKLGTVVANPGLKITGVRGAKDPFHAIKRITVRGVPTPAILETVRHPAVVLKQAGDNFLHLSKDAGVVLRADGQIVTAYSRADFKPQVLEVLRDAGVIP